MCVVVRFFLNKIMKNRNKERLLQIVSVSESLNLPLTNRFGRLLPYLDIYLTRVTGKGDSTKINEDIPNHYERWMLSAHINLQDTVFTRIDNSYSINFDFTIKVYLLQFEPFQNVKAI